MANFYIQHELFAPLLYVVKIKSLEEGIMLNNSVPQGTHYFIIIIYLFSVFIMSIYTFVVVLSDVFNDLCSNVYIEVFDRSGFVNFHHKSGGHLQMDWSTRIRLRHRECQYRTIRRRNWRRLWWRGTWAYTV